MVTAAVAIITEEAMTVIESTAIMVAACGAAELWR
jgi:hypothetical protein